MVDLLTGTLESVTDLTLFGGANALAIESAPGAWEIVQSGKAELLAPGRYRLTRLLRGQRGTEGAMDNPAPAGAQVVVLDSTLAPLPIAEADLGIPWNWRIGPASRPASDETYVAKAFTPEGMGLRLLSVTHVEQPWRKSRTPGDLTIRWTRRSRSLAADSWGALEVTFPRIRPCASAMRRPIKPSTSRGAGPCAGSLRLASDQAELCACPVNARGPAAKHAFLRQS